MITKTDVKIIKGIDKYISTYSSIKTIIDNTVETWQPNRSTTSKTNDTKLGKLAEGVVSAYIKTTMPHVQYLSYDDFRTNNFKKHAPFDGLLFLDSVPTLVLKNIIDEMNIEITKNKYGKITDTLKYKSLINHLFITEIKSTRVTNRHKNRDGNVDIDKLLADDFLEYPKYIRVDKDNKINNFQDYIKFLKENRGFKCKNELSCEDNIKKIEKANMRHIYIRVYIDEFTNTAYIIGCINMQEFLKNVVLKKMKQYGKSEMAIYLSTSLKNGVNIDFLSNIK